MKLVPQGLRISVGRRLAILIFVEMATTLGLLLLGLSAVARLTRDETYIHRFIETPIEEIEGILDETGLLIEPDLPKERVGVVWRRTEDFVKWYRTSIQLEGNPSTYAEQQRDELRAAGRMELADKERRIVDEIEAEVARLSRRDRPLAGDDVDGLRADLRKLLKVNLEFVNVAQDASLQRSRVLRATLILVGIGGILFAGAAGFLVRRAIAPRIANLVEKVERFREFGVLERVSEQGSDEIAVLANALDLGFAAIANRNRERERFLAVAAHELKTPMVSILGFVEAARANPAQRDRALDVIRRQTGRLGRLVEDLLWAASARNGQLAFHPIPVDFVALVQRLASEVEEATPDRKFSVEAPQSIYFLADEGLLSHAIWSLLTYTNALSTPNMRVEIKIEQINVRVLMNIQIHGPTLSPEELARVFEPFSSMQYEGERGRHRSAFGLFLCREIAVLHGGSLRVVDVRGTGPIVVLDLPS